jgi:hypothetical protein
VAMGKAWQSLFHHGGGEAKNEELAGELVWPSNYAMWFSSSRQAPRPKVSTTSQTGPSAGQKSIQTRAHEGYLLPNQSCAEDRCERPGSGDTVGTWPASGSS